MGVLESVVRLLLAVALFPLLSSCQQSYKPTSVEQAAITHTITILPQTDTTTKTVVSTQTNTKTETVTSTQTPTTSQGGNGILSQRAVELFSNKVVDIAPGQVVTFPVELKAWDRLSLSGKVTAITSLLMLDIAAKAPGVLAGRPYIADDGKFYGTFSANFTQRTQARLDFIAPADDTYLIVVRYDLDPYGGRNPPQITISATKYTYP